MATLEGSGTTTRSRGECVVYCALQVVQAESCVVILGY